MPHYTNLRSTCSISANSNCNTELQGVQIAKKFEALVQKDSRFEVPAKRHLGLVVFRLKVAITTKPS